MQGNGLGSCFPRFHETDGPPLQNIGAVDNLCHTMCLERIQDRGSVGCFDKPRPELQFEGNIVTGRPSGPVVVVMGWHQTGEIHHDRTARVENCLIDLCGLERGGKVELQAIPLILFDQVGQGMEFDGEKVVDIGKA